MSRPLDGLLVVSLEQAIAAPYCTRLLADQGARVIKVERPDGGDFARAYDKRARGLASHFVWTNRSKESLALDLKEPAALDALGRIIARADVFVQNLAPGAAARLGLDQAKLRTKHPKLITCSISGYGNGAGHATIYPYGPYDTADGGVFFGLQNDREWSAFAEGVLKRPDLANDPGFRGNSGRADRREVLEPVIVATFAALSTEEAIARLEKAGIATARVNDMAALWAHPQLAARGRWAEIGSPAGLLPALKPVSGDRWQPRLDPVPALGEHTDAILAEFCLDEVVTTKATT